MIARLSYGKALISLILLAISNPAWARPCSQYPIEVIQRAEAETANMAAKGEVYNSSTLKIVFDGALSRAMDALNLHRFVIIGSVITLTDENFYLCYPKLRRLIEVGQQAQLANNQAELKRAKEEQELANRPQNILRNAYSRYIIVRKCFDARNGYAQVYVSSEELERARIAVAKIEQSMLARDGSITKDSLWLKANEDTESIGGLSLNREVCQFYLMGLDSAYRTSIPDAGVMKKDF